MYASIVTHGIIENFCCLNKHTFYLNWINNFTQLIRSQPKNKNSLIIFSNNKHNQDGTIIDENPRL